MNPTRERSVERGNPNVLINSQGKILVDGWLGISFKDVVASNYKEAYGDIVELISRLYTNHRYLLEDDLLAAEEKIDFLMKKVKTQGTEVEREELTIGKPDGKLRWREATAEELSKMDSVMTIRGQIFY